MFKSLVPELLEWKKRKSRVSAARVSSVKKLRNRCAASFSSNHFSIVRNNRIFSFMYDRCFLKVKLIKVTNESSSVLKLRKIVIHCLIMPDSRLRNGDVRELIYHDALKAY